MEGYAKVVPVRVPRKRYAFVDPIPAGYMYALSYTCPLQWYIEGLHEVIVASSFGANIRVYA
jgi:hypothetical protein